VVIIALTALYFGVRYRQKHRRAVLRIPTPPTGVIFPEVPPSEYDSTLINCIKTFYNYGFYKFGFEVIYEFY
jgi:hypothetical protein